MALHLTAQLARRGDEPVGLIPAHPADIESIAGAAVVADFVERAQ